MKFISLPYDEYYFYKPNKIKKSKGPINVQFIDSFRGFLHVVLVRAYVEYKNEFLSFLYKKK